MISVKNLFLLLVVSLFFFGCSSKSLYKPEQIAGYVSYDGSLPAKIVDVTRAGATLENRQIISKQKGLLNIKIPKENRFLAQSEDKIISVSPVGKITIQNINSKTIFSYDFHKMVASADMKDDLLAIVFSDNTISVFDVKNKKMLFNTKLDSAYALDARMANPYFLGNLIVFPTLDGRLVIVDKRSFSIVKDIVVSSKPNFNNVIFLDVLDNKLVAATENRVISITPKSVEFMNVSIKDIIFLGRRVFVFTKDGRIVLTTSDLKPLKEKKFKFANFSTAIYGNFIYVIEKNGYLIAVDKDLMTTNVYKLPDEIDNLMFTTKDTLYYDDKYFRLNRVK